MATLDEPPPQYDTETDEEYVRRTGQYPPSWSKSRCQLMDSKTDRYKEMSARAVDFNDRRRARAWLTRWGVTPDE